jgi:hypothetical protein
MLNKINLFYGLTGFMIFLFFLFQIDESFIPILIFNFFNFLFVTISIFLFLKKKGDFYNASNLIFHYVCFAFLYIFLINLISYFYNNNFLVFSETDANTYDIMAKVFNSKSSFKDGVLYVFDFYDYDDLGAVVLIAILYRIVESNLIVNFFYLVIGALTANSIFRISNYHMNDKYSFLCAWVFSSSSFVLWFHSSGLKESFLIFLVVQSVLFYYKLYRELSLKSGILLVVFLALIMFFRPPITFLLLAGFGLSIVLNLKNKIAKGFIFLIISGLFFLSFSEISKQQERFIVGDDFDEMMEIKESTGMVKGGVGFSYAVNVIGALIGPLPTFNINEKTLISFYSPGLYLRTLLGFTFIGGLYYSIKQRNYFLMPIISYTLFEIISLVFILEALELRKSLPHFPFIYIISFYFLYAYDTKAFSWNTKYNFLFKINLMFLLIVLIMVAFWNQRF